MKAVEHQSAKATHYDKESAHYDDFNAKNSVTINKIIEKILKKYKASTVLDMTCGTGSQVFWLIKKGFKVIGSDINAKMLSIARQKAAQEKIDVKLIKGDMRKLKTEKSDAAITIFNAIGHLTKQDFSKTLNNIHNNLHDEGLYIFDNFNLNYLLHKDNITKLTIDVQKKSKKKIVREIQYSTINAEGVLASYDIYHEQISNNAPKISTAFQTLQTYSAKQLKFLLKENGFKVLHITDSQGNKFSDTKSERLLVTAQKEL